MGAEFPGHVHLCQCVNPAWLSGQEVFQLARIVRIFPRKTSATPDDDLAIIARQPGMFDQADEVHISVAFTWDLPVAERLEKLWRQVAPVRIGGPAMNEPGGDFVPGMYVKKGYVLTSRGCPNRCWFCQVWRREGATIRELPITDGWNLLDDNLLACSESHQRAVFEMLGRHKGHRIEFTGGLEAARLQPWHVDELLKLRPQQMFFAYDTPDDLEPLRVAGKMLHEAGFSLGGALRIRAYVLCGYPGDTKEKAFTRMKETIDAGFLPMAMLYRDSIGKRDPEWMPFVRQWIRPALIKRWVKGNICRGQGEGV
jgi:hypothetical protein